MKKFIAMLLSMSMMFTMGVNAFASAPDNAEEVVINTETVYLESENGAVLPTTITEYQISPYASEDAPDLGTSKMKKFTWTSSDIQRFFSQLGVTGELLSATEKRQLSQELAGKISKVDLLILATTLASYIYDDLSGIVWGDEWEFSIVLVWSREYYNAGGYYVEGWDYGYTEFEVN